MENKQYKRVIGCIHFAILSVIFLVGCNSSNSSSTTKSNQYKPKISFTFDDGSIKDMPNHGLTDWNQRILDTLEKHKIKAVLFAAGSRLQGEKGRYVLSSWNNAGHKIANHTFTHPYFNSEKTTLESFKSELLKNDKLISNYSNYYKFFRFPYLKEGNNVKKRDSFRKFLKENNYKIGHVTIDASDWYIDSRLVKRLKDRPDPDISRYKQFYIEHIYERALFYDSLAFKLTNRRINHNLLLHHNLASALFLDDLILYFKEKGWQVMDADVAFTDNIYKLEPENIPAGESLIWALAKQSGKFENVLRYPAEDSRYEKERMDELGL